MANVDFAVVVDGLLMFGRFEFWVGIVGQGGPIFVLDRSVGGI